MSCFSSQLTFELQKFDCFIGYPPQGQPPYQGGYMPYHGGPPNQPYQSPTGYHQGKFIEYISY